MKKLVALAVLAAVSSFAMAQASADADPGPNMVLEKYTKPGSAIVYRRWVEQKAVTSVASPAPAPTSAEPVAMETYTKPGSAIVYRRPVAGVMTAAAAD